MCFDPNPLVRHSMQQLGKTKDDADETSDPKRDGQREMSRNSSAEDQEEALISAMNQSLRPSKVPSINRRTELYWLSPNCGDPSKLTFPQQMHRLLREHDSTNVVSWLPDGKAFVVLDQKQFTGNVLPQYFGKNIAYTSWTRRLRRWGWQNVAKSTYYNEHFHRDRPMQCLRMNYDRTPNRDMPDRPFQHEGFSCGGGNSSRPLNSSSGVASMGMDGSSRSLNSSASTVQPLFAQGQQQGARGGLHGMEMDSSSMLACSSRNLAGSSIEMGLGGMQGGFPLASEGGVNSGLSIHAALQSCSAADASSHSGGALSRSYVSDMKMGMMERQKENMNRVQMKHNMTMQQIRQQEELLAHQQRLMQMTMSHASNHETMSPDMQQHAHQGCGPDQHPRRSIGMAMEVVLIAFRMDYK
jgi:hypothetical protein